MRMSRQQRCVVDAGKSDFGGFEQRHQRFDTFYGERLRNDAIGLRPVGDALRSRGKFRVAA